MIFLFQVASKLQVAAEKIIRYKLKNGLDVLLVNDASTPVVAVDLWYKVGSKNEEPGKSGFAHLFEHMMFEGSENVGKAQHLKLITDVGGWVNGSTNKDRTNYFEVVPANQLRLALWLEADRMRSLKVTRENFENQRATVKEERRLRVDNQPYGAIFAELLDELAYENWAYKHSVIGSMEDLDKATLEDVRKFHDLYYKPNNAVLAVVGDIDYDKTLELIRAYFEDIPAGETPPPVDLNEPPQTAEKRMQWQDKFAPLPAYVSAYHIPPRGQKDYYTMEIIETLLFDGESSRVYRRLVEEEGKALHIFGGVDSKLGPNLFIFFAQAKPGHTISELEESYVQELRKLQEEPISRMELQKVKNKLKAEYFTRLERVINKADLLCMYTAFFDDPELFNTELNRYLEISPEDIQQAAQKYFRTENHSVIEVIPANK